VPGGGWGAAGGERGRGGRRRGRALAHPARGAAAGGLGSVAPPVRALRVRLPTGTLSPDTGWLEGLCQVVQIVSSVLRIHSESHPFLPVPQPAVAEGKRPRREQTHSRDACCHALPPGRDSRPP